MNRMGAEGWGWGTPAERLGLAAAVALAATLRFWGWSAVGMDHFDEGVYAFTGLSWSDAGQPLSSYPDQILFSPPVYPFLVSLAFRVFGASGSAAIAVSATVGVVTVLLLGLVGRRWFGPGAGVAAAVLLAVDPLHVMLSRAALTDVTFLLFFLLGLAAAVETFREQSWRWAVVAGLATGLAWNTKYHGWFVLLIAGWGLLAALWASRGNRTELVRTTLLWCLMAGTATACYMPWALHVQSEMGYRALLAYQSTNAAGSWTDNLVRQVGQQAFLENAWSRPGPALAAVLVLLVGDRRESSRSLILVGALAVAGVVVGQGAVTLCLLLAALALGLRGGASTAAWVLGGWAALWLASAPLYDPYARLLAPLWVAAALGSAWLLVWLSSVTVSNGPGPQEVGEGPWGLVTRRPVWLLSALVVLVASLAGVWREESRPQGLWRPGDGMEKAARELARTVPEGSRVVVLAEPELAFYLHMLGRPAFERRDLPQEVAAIQDTVYLAVGRYVRGATYLRENILEALSGRLVPLDTVHVVARDLRILDDFEPADARRYADSPTGAFDVTLYRLHPGESE